MGAKLRDQQLNLGLRAKYCGCYGWFMGNAKTGTNWVRVGGNLYRRGRHGVCYARIERGGKETWKSLRTKSPAVAKAELAKIEAKMARMAAPMETDMREGILRWRWMC